MARTPPTLGYRPAKPPAAPPRNINDPNNKVNPARADAQAAPPSVLPGGGIPTPGQVYVPYEPGMGSGPGGTGDPTAPPSGGGGGGGGDAPDWASSFFSGFGLPPDVVAQVNKIFAQYSDVNAASAAALAYIRGTPWYAATYPGIAEGIKKGLVSNEADYRNLLNQQSQLYKQYLGRDITGDEFAANLGEGVNLSTIGGRLQGAALVGTYGKDWQYTLGAFDTAPSTDELTALGRESAGLDTPLGQRVKRRLDLATQRMQGVFRGTLATPGLTTASGRLSAPGLAPGSGPQADVAA